MSQITYRPQLTNPWRTDVYLDGKLIGTIRCLGPGKHQYYPRGSKTGGEVFKSMRECQQSLEGEE